jgi:hypothetical protein
MRRRLAEQQRRTTYEAIHGHPPPVQMAATTTTMDGDGGGEANGEDLESDLYKLRPPDNQQNTTAKGKRPLMRRIWRYLREAWTGVMTGSGTAGGQKNSRAQLLTTTR